MKTSWTEQSSVNAVIKATFASEDDAKAYLLAEEGDITNAIISYKGDRGGNVANKSCE